MMRPDPDYKSLYHNQYDQANYGQSLAGRMMAKSHELLEKEFDRDAYFPRVLEVGTGTGQHVKFVRHRFNSYHMTDRDSEMLQLGELVDERWRCPDHPSKASFQSKSTRSPSWPTRNASV
jgi:ubiquinone/menaquinone biosynthesis C-methylase UbiE